MENTQLPLVEDDLFTSNVTVQRASSSRIHFTPNDPITGRPRSAQKTLSGTNPPARRGSPLNPLNAAQTTDLRRRPWPSDGPLPSSDSSSRHHRGKSQVTGLMARLADPPEVSTMAEDTDLEVGAFSNEYDLAHEDPRILQDVQRALKLKARREARMKKDTISTPEKPTSNHTSPSSQRESTPGLPFPAGFSPSPSFTPSKRKTSNSTSSDVDFSPSTGAFEFPSISHPIPASLDNGMTLDWTSGSPYDGEKRWAKSISKRRERDKLPPLGVMVDQQEKMHKEKLARISHFTSAQTTRKAHITSQQLGRRYNIIYQTLGTKKSSFSLTKVTRWYGSQPEVVRKSLEKAEPLTWLKHLDKHSPNTARSPWHLSALIMEEYLQTREHNEHMQTIPEDSLPGTSPLYSRKSRSPSFLSPQGEADDRISFEPLAEAKRHSSDAASRKSAESALSSLQSVSSNAPLSPVSDHTRDRRPTPAAERAPSPRSSSSDVSDYQIPIPAKLQVVTNSLAVPEVTIHPPSSDSAATKPQNPGPISLTTSTGSSSSTHHRQLASPAGQSVTSLSLRTSLRPRKRMTLPNDIHSVRRRKKARDEREEQLRQEYEAKALLLKEADSHNGHTRQMLNRISSTIKEYDSIQTLGADDLKIHLVKIPKDVIEVFAHDPSNVTRETRRLRSWRAVEDVYLRIRKQRKTLSTFLESFQEEAPMLACPLDQYIDDLLQQLELLKGHNSDIFSEAENVAALLKSVQDTQGKVKEEYNKTVAHVSVVYPQLSHIVALEESYKDQYQQFWELGMDALTLLLDTVTPFWRTYGKTIGKDVTDFLIIPLYRNEFTGEPKRYHIEEFPTRSLRHWFGLGLFFLASIIVDLLQVRTAMTSTLNSRLLFIPYDGVRWTALPFFWFTIIIQWLAVIFESAIVIMQLGVITWWIGWSIKVLS